MSLVKKPKHVEVAMQYGLIMEGWALEKYLRHAVEAQGYETCVIHGRQGSGKSNFMLQQGWWILRDWDEVLKALVFTPGNFVSTLKSLGKGNRIPWIGFDDVGVSYPASTFRTDIKLYQDVDSCWAAIRTKVSVVSLTIPLIDRLSKNIRDNVSFEIYIGRNQRYIVERIIRLPSFKTVETAMLKILVEQGHLDLYNIPRDVFKEYWEMRLELTERALDKLERSVDLGDTEGYTAVLDLAEELNLSPNTIQQMASRGVIRSQKIDGLLYIDDEYIPKLKNIYANREAKATAKGEL